MSTNACPHCGVPNATGSPFCASCGKALPTAYPAGPRFVTNNAPATTSAGAKLQGAELHKKSKSAAGALCVVAVLLAIGGFIDLSKLPANVDPQLRMIVMGIDFGVAAVFFLLFIWALKQPFPAAIVGLVLFILLQVLIAVGNPLALFQGIIVKIIIVVVLVKAIQAGAAHRRLMRDQAPGFPVV